MEEERNTRTRDELKKYFERGDQPTESQFAELIDSYAHLNELNFGLSITSGTTTVSKYYHFYRADDVVNSGAGHKIVEDPNEAQAQEISNYNHILSRRVHYKNLDIKLRGAIDVEKHRPKIIIERYKQKKKLQSGFLRPAKYYQENNKNAVFWNRSSEYEVTANEMVVDIGPIHYFKPKEDFKDFSPSGSLNRPGSFKLFKHNKTFVPLRFILEIDINGSAYRSQPVNAKIILGSSGESDAINFIFD